MISLALVCLRNSFLGLDVGRSDEAKVKYEKLVSHPNGAIRKKARQFLFGFKVLPLIALKVSSFLKSQRYAN